MSDSRPRKFPPTISVISNPEADEFYYNAQGFMVFTVAYHLKRGYCCENGCRHCPYGFKKKEP